MCIEDFIEERAEDLVLVQLKPDGTFEEVSTSLELSKAAAREIWDSEIFDMLFDEYQRNQCDF